MEKEKNITLNFYKEFLVSRELCYKYNNLSPLDEVNKDAILRQLLGKAGKNLKITQPFYCDFGFNIEVGDDFFSNYNFVILDGAKVIAGNNVWIAPHCCFTTVNHPLDAEQRNQCIEYADPIILKDNVWIGANVTILSGVTIGENSVIGAGSVVTRDIPSNVIAVGNPCKVLREITEKDKYDPSKHITLSFNT